MDLRQCYNCGHGGWNSHELKDGLCPFCYEDDYDDEEDDFDCCNECDLPDACADFGCAIKQGIRKDPF